MEKTIWVIAGIVSIIAVVIITTNPRDVTLNTPNGTMSGEVLKNEPFSKPNDGIKISVEGVKSQASYYDTEINGTTVEIFAVRGSDGMVHLAMNTCQVCNGSPHAYFKQNGDYFVCQNCGNRFSTDKIGIERGGCNPVPVTKEDYTESEGVITVSQSFLEKNAYRFSKWKKQS